MNSVLSDIQDFFFTAMQAGYAAEEVPKAKVVDMPGYKEIRYEDPGCGGWLLVDRWCVNPDTDRSAGTTTIWWQDKPVWFMSYGGFYPQAYIPFLKKVLRQQYAKEMFIGGRGPYRFNDPSSDMIYTNRPQLNGYNQFKGREEILGISLDKHTVELAGWHEYWGMSLI